MTHLRHALSLPNPTPVRRKPCGRWCKVIAVDISTGDMKIKDGRWVGWVKAKTFAEKWTT